MEKLVPDGNLSFLGGCNEGVHPSLLKDSQTRRNVNISLIKGTIRPRLPYKEITLEFLSEELAKSSPVSSSSNYERIFRKGRIQHVGKYQSPIGEYLLLVITGIIFLVDIRDRTIQVVPLLELNDKTANFFSNRLHGTQAGDFYIIFDWPNQPIIIHPDLTAKRAKASNQEIPKSFIGTFVHNRTIVANKGTEFGASDPRRPDNPRAAIEFKESIVGPGNLNPQFADQFFSLTYVDKMSNITAMGYLKQTDGTSAIGFGPLFVSTKEAIHLFSVNQPRVNWEESQFGSAYIFNYGIVGQRAVANVGADLIYRAYDGMIYATSRLYSNQRGWGLTNISEELRESFDSINKHLLSYSFLTYHNNSLYCALKPFLVQAENLWGVPSTDVVFEGIGMLEMATVSGVNSEGASPIWAGVNEGLFVDCLEVYRSLVYVAKRAPLGEENIILIQEEVSGSDWYINHYFPIRARFYTREFNWPEHFIHDKNIHFIQLFFSRFSGTISISVHIRESGKDWEFFGRTVLTEESGELNPPIHRIEGITGCANRVQFRVDIQGNDYELLSMLVFAQPQEYVPSANEYEVELIKDFSTNEDLSLWYKRL